MCVLSVFCPCCCDYVQNGFRFDERDVLDQNNSPLSPNVITSLTKLNQILYNYFYTEEKSHLFYLLLLDLRSLWMIGTNAWLCR